MSLDSRLRFPGETGIRIGLPDRFEVYLMEFPRTPAELDELLQEVQSWLNEVGLEALAVRSQG